jgi:superfamily I DNA/RNA helicase
MAWHLARARLQPLSDVIHYLYATGAYLPAPGEVMGIVQRYEDAKQRDRRIDFDDLLGRFAGIRFSLAGPEQCEPVGEVPDNVVGWFFDEAQDSSALLVAAQKRLLTGASVRWCWLGADPFQAVHTWNGADPSLFLNWPADKERSLTQSFRCPEPIIKLGERCLRQLGDTYYDRQVAPATHDGEVCSMYDVEDAIDAVSPSTSTLVLARTNKHVRQLEKLLAKRDVPYQGIKPDAEPNAKKQARAALLRLSLGETVPQVDIGPILHLFNYKVGDTRLLADGCRDAWKKRHPKPDSVRLQDLGGIGATADLIAAIASGKWTQFDPRGQDFVRMARKWGAESVLRPKVKVGTIHASKGTEADHVVFCAGSSRPIYEQQDESKDRYDEECRLEYTAVTRTRHRLTVAPDLKSKFQMNIADLV